MICLSFDTDRLDERRMEEFLELVPIPGRATFFCTQRYRALLDTPHEVGPHALLPEGGDWANELVTKRREFPEATGWRSHSCVFSHLLAERLAALGYRYVSTHDEPGRQRPQPFRQAWGLWHLPIFYMDNLDFSARRFWRDAPEPFDRRLIDLALSDDGVYVFAFHPIHLLLNSPDAETYFQLRERWERGADVANLRHAGYGTLSYYEELIEAAAEADTASVALTDALDTYISAAPATARS